MRKIFFIGAFVLAAFLMIISFKVDSPTTDESIHLAAGYTYLTQRDFRLDPEHPPLLKEIGALPLLFQKNVKTVLDENWQRAGEFYYDSWQEARILGQNFLFRENPPAILFWPRLVFVFLTLILAAFSYFWAKKLYGEKAGIFAAFLCLFSPTILAHGRLVNTDLGLALFILMTAYFWGKFLKKPNWTNVVLAGLFIGLALASKFTALILIPILIMLGIVKIVIDRDKANWIKYLIGFLLALIVAGFIVWGSYEFLGLADFFKGIVLIFRHAFGGHASYLLGQNSVTGWWYYFPVAILFKTSLAFFIFLALAIFGKIKAKDRFDEYLLLLPPIIFLGLSMFSKADLGIRHILPIFPFLFIYASKSANLISWQNGRQKILSIIFAFAVVWYLVAALIAFPNFLAYFNELAVGSKNGYKILTDSNLDWGQDIYRIKNYLAEHDIKHVYIVYPWNGDTALKYYGVNFTPLTVEDQSIKGPVVISATYYQRPGYEWLRQYPFEQITPGVFFIIID